MPPLLDSWWTFEASCLEKRSSLCFTFLPSLKSILTWVQTLGKNYLALSYIGADTHSLSHSLSLLYFQHQPVIEGDKFLSECNPVQKKNFFIRRNRTRKLKPASKIFLIGKLFGVTWYFHFFRHPFLLWTWNAPKFISSRVDWSTFQLIDLVSMSLINFDLLMTHY